ncbi:MAG: 30S ribosomal protein S3ae [Candidatus Helarchaeales archaeon]
MGKSRRRQKQVDTWKLKQWFTVEAPPYFDNKEICVTPAKEINNVLGRVFETTLYDLTGDFRLAHVKLFFKANDLKNDIVQTKYVGHDFTRDYIRALVRRSTSQITGIFNIQTKDGYKLRVTALIFTQKRCKTHQQKLIRAIMQETILAAAEKLNFIDFVKDAVSGEMAQALAEECKIILPIRKSEVMKIKVLQEPSAAE